MCSFSWLPDSPVALARIKPKITQAETPSDSSDGLETGAFNVPLRLAQGCSSTDTHSGSILFTKKGDSKLEEAYYFGVFVSGQGKGPFRATVPTESPE